MARVALVTGGTRGIGHAISAGLKSAGYTVAANYGGNDEAANKFKDETGIPVYKFDVSDFEACKQGLAQIEGDLGPVEVLVNNAGITRDKPLHKMEPEHWNAVIATDLTSVFNLSRLVIDGMRERKFGRIINISSINGQKGQFGQCNYAAAKAGIIGLTKGLAGDLGPFGIRVNAVAPGWVMTERKRALWVTKEGVEATLARQCLKQEIQPDDMVGPCLFLASEAARMVTAQVLIADGGFL